MSEKSFRSSTKIIGDDGEERACDFLKKNGYTVIKRNWRTRTGEIDIIAKSSNTIVFVEVKTLPHGYPELIPHIINKKKTQRIVETSKCFLANNRQYNKNYIRYDVVILDMPGFPEVYHIQNAFSES